MIKAAQRKFHWFHVTCVSLVGLQLGLLPVLAGDVPPCPLADIENAIIIPTADVTCSAEETTSLEFDFGVYGGTSEGDAIGGLNASVFVPFTDSFALQFDGDIGGFQGDLYGQTALHALAIQSDVGSFGAYGSWSGFEGSGDVWRFGGEANLDFNGFALAAVGGWQSEGKHGVFFDSKASFELTELTSVYVGYAYDDLSMGKLGFNHQFASSSDALGGMSMFAETRLATNNDVTALAGISFSFGSRNDAYCPKPGTKKAFKANHWLMASPVKKVSSAGAGVRACTFADLGQRLGITIDENGIGSDGCTYGGLIGNVVNGDVSACGTSGGVGCGSG